MRRIIVRPRRIPLVQQTRVYTADEQQVRDLLKAKLETALLMGRLSRG
jgi:hypothetical protein